MWVLIIAIILVVSTFFAAYLAKAYTTDIGYGTFAKQVSMLLVMVTLVLSFIVDWRKGESNAKAI